jgi:hypothetical protein
MQHGFSARLRVPLGNGTAISVQNSHELRGFNLISQKNPGQNNFGLPVDLSLRGGCQVLVNARATVLAYPSIPNINPNMQSIFKL